MDNGFLCLEIEEYAIQLEGVGNLLSIFLDLVEQERIGKQEIAADETAESFKQRLFRFYAIVHVCLNVIDRTAAEMNDFISNNSKNPIGDGR